MFHSKELLNKGENKEMAALSIMTGKKHHFLSISYDQTTGLEIDIWRPKKNMTLCILHRELDHHKDLIQDEDSA